MTKGGKEGWHELGRMTEKMTKIRKADQEEQLSRKLVESAVRR